MPLHIRGLIVSSYPKSWFFLAILPAIAYGVVLVLSGSCFYLLIKKKDTYPKHLWIILPIYIIVMLLCSTWMLVGSICQLMNVLTPLHTSVFFSSSFGLPLTVNMWGADGFMVMILITCQEPRFTMQLQIWRCLVLYQDVSRGLRVGIIVLLSLISFASFGKPISISTPLYSKCS